MTLQAVTSPVLALCFLSLAGCGAPEDTLQASVAGQPEALGASGAEQQRADGEENEEEGEARGALGRVVFVLGNEAEANRVHAFRHSHDGVLTPAGNVETGGRGSGAGLGSQGALALSVDGRWLVVVNAGSDDVSLFQVRGAEVSLVAVAPSGGHNPVSVTMDRDLVFVVNDDGIAGLERRRDSLVPIPGATAPLSAPSADPAQVAFSPDGEHLAVTEKATNRVDLYRVAEDGRVEGPAVFPSPGETPFGFEFRRDGVLVISEAFGGRPGESALSSFQIEEDALEVLSASVPDFRAAACWVSITRNGKIAYTTNTGSDGISSYSVDREGRLALLSSDAASTGPGSAPTDMGLSHAGRFLFVLESGSGEISSFRVGRDGSLELAATVGGLPASAVGLVAR